MLPITGSVLKGLNFLVIVQKYANMKTTLPYWSLKSDPGSYSNSVPECGLVVDPCYVYYFQRGRVYFGYI